MDNDMKMTGEEVIQTFENLCDKYGKLFIPDQPRQESVAVSLAKHYSKDDLLYAIDRHINTNKGPFLVFEFALVSRTIVDKAKFERESGNKFKMIVEETRKKIENNEL